jgi:DNA processing protein
LWFLLLNYTRGSMESTIQKISSHEILFPSLLREIDGCPEELFYYGDISYALPAVAIVGTRRARPEGCEVARGVARDLARHGFLVVSGMAFGIDAAAHEGALEGGGKTWAVLACGIDRPYPREHAGLARRIVAGGGAVVSEYPPGTEPFRSNFLDRNRIVSGLCVATVVVEAPIRSGALTTARYAAEQGRDVFVVPGGVRVPQYGGSHMLIRHGARLVTSSTELLDDLRSLVLEYPSLEPIFSSAQGGYAPTANALNSDQRTVFEALTHSGEPLGVDRLSEVTTLEPHVVNQSLTSLMLSDLVAENNGTFFTI